MIAEIKELAEQLVSVAIKADKTISLAESCTGGLIAAVITSVSGASLIFYGSAVTYHNNAKENILGVEETILKNNGAVSAQCAIQMARGARIEFKTDISVSVTGIAGPAGGSKEKPVGTVWVGVASEKGCRAYLCRFKGDRNAIREATVKEVLSLLIRELI